MKGFLTAKQLAQRWKMSEGTLANWRSAKTGPRYHHFGWAIAYDVDVVRKWEKNPELLRGRLRGPLDTKT